MVLDLTARAIMERCDILSHFSEDAHCLTRRFATGPMREVNAAVAAWMRAAGMTVQVDAIGNVIGRYEASTTGSGVKTLLLGSHLDTVRDAGKYDGPLGVMVALACVERLHQRGERLPFAIEVLGFADEEGVRYHTAYIGSRAVAGIFDASTLELQDDDGMTLAEAIRQFAGDPDLLYTPRWRCEELLGYCEVHIEQGPVLEIRDLPVGVVSAISGQNRYALTFAGKAGHAGTVPMLLRHDALCAASEFILATESLAQTTPGLVATVGKLTVRPNASNVIPGHVTLSLDVRHQDGAVLEQACNDLYTKGEQISQERCVGLKWHMVQKDQKISCDPRLVGMLEQAIEQVGHPVLALPSGAGHDGVSLSHLTPIAMLFVRCKGGISHHPEESVTIEDVEVALNVMDRFLHALGNKREEGVA